MKRNDETTIENISKPLGKPGKGFVHTSTHRVDSNLLYKKIKSSFVH